MGELLLLPQHGSSAALLLGRQAKGCRLGCMGMFPSVEEAMEVLALLGAIEALRAQG